MNSFVTGSPTLPGSSNNANILAPKPVSAAHRYGLQRNDLSTGSLTRHSSESSWQNIIGVGSENRQGGLNQQQQRDSGTVTPSSLKSYDFLDDFSATSTTLGEAADQLIEILKQEHESPIQLINFEGVLDYFEKNKHICLFCPEHHLELAVRIAADPTNLAEVFDAMALYVTSKRDDQNINLIFDLLKIYLIRIDHALSDQFKNEVFDDQLSNRSRVDDARGETSTIASDEGRQSDDDDDLVGAPEELAFSFENVIYDDSLCALNSPPPSHENLDSNNRSDRDGDNRDGSESDDNDNDDDDDDDDTSSSQDESSPKNKFDELSPSLDQLKLIQKNLQKNVFAAGSFLYPSVLNRFNYRGPLPVYTKYAPEFPAIPEIKKLDSDDAEMEELD